jgi:DNA mismatch repair protein MutL
MLRKLNILAYSRVSKLSFKLGGPMIRILQPEVIDRIAAGEVLDRPANLVKELVENSIDAGATQIDIEFEAGGRRVMIADDGAGMSAADLQLAPLRHATSKIESSDDLFRLHSFGFRGEALASIAAVSRMSLTSRVRGSEQGYRLQSEFGVMNEPTPISAREGTEIRIEDLFTNVPARLKFLKSEPAEHGQIKTTIKALAMAHENVGFSVRCKGQLIFHWPKNQTFQERALAVLESDGLFAGEAEIKNGELRAESREPRAENRTIRAEVLVSSPQETNNINRNMWFFVQGRWVQDRSLSAAVMEAHRNLLMHGEYPTVVVRLTLPADEVDVNVHPTKSQVKFRDSQSAFRAVSRAVRGVLETAPWLPQVTAMLIEPPQFEAPQDSLKFSDVALDRTQYPKKSFPAQIEPLPVKNFAPQETMPAFRWADLQVIGQLTQTYIVAQNQDALFLVDQHASHERVVFERLMESCKAGKIEIQNLLMPLVFDFTCDEAEALVKAKGQVEKLGLVIDRMGPESIAVQAIPTIVTESAVSTALKRLAHELSENMGEFAWERMLADIFASMACHSVVRAGQTLSNEEMKSLLVQMDQYPLSSFCPHGRPVFVKRRFSEIDREFGRIV